MTPEQLSAIRQLNTTTTWLPLTKKTWQVGVIDKSKPTAVGSLRSNKVEGLHQRYNTARRRRRRQSARLLRRYSKLLCLRLRQWWAWLRSTCWLRNISLIIVNYDCDYRTYISVLEPGTKKLDLTLMGLRRRYPSSLLQTCIESLFRGTRHRDCSLATFPDNAVLHKQPRSAGAEYHGMPLSSVIYRSYGLNGLIPSRIAAKKRQSNRSRSE